MLQRAREKAPFLRLLLHMKFQPTFDMSSNPRNVYIIGAQCTGKTTLVTALTEHFTSLANQQASTEAATSSSEINPPAGQPYIIREVARSVLKEYAFTAAEIRDSPSRALELQQLILRAQVEAETKALNTASWFISDRSGLDPMIYAEMYVGREATEQMLAGEDWKACQQSLSKALIVVCEPGAPWLYDDGTRLMPLDETEWTTTHETFCRFLDKLELSYLVARKELMNMRDRVQLILSNI